MKIAFVLAVSAALFCVACGEVKPPAQQRANLEISGSSECLAKAMLISMDYAPDASAPEWSPNHVGRFEAAEIKLSQFGEVTSKLRALRCDLKIRRRPCRPLLSDVSFCSAAGE
jgi:hypothetical protein